MRHLLVLCTALMFVTGGFTPRSLPAQSRAGVARSIGYNMGFSRYASQPQQNNLQKQQTQQYQKAMQQAAQQAAAAELQRREKQKQASDARKEKEDTERQKRIARNKAEQAAKTDVLKLSADEKSSATTAKP